MIIIRQLVLTIRHNLAFQPDLCHCREVQQVDRAVVHQVKFLQLAESQTYLRVGNEIGVYTGDLQRGQNIVVYLYIVNLTVEHLDRITRGVFLISELPADELRLTQMKKQE